jgi:hypothetical protein
MRNHFDLGIQRPQPLARRFRLQRADLRRLEQHLPLQVRNIHAIAVDETQRADAGSREI